MRIVTRLAMIISPGVASGRHILVFVVAVAATERLGARAVIASPILGPQGNREFLLHLAPGPGCADIGDRIVEVSEPFGSDHDAPTEPSSDR